MKTTPEQIITIKHEKRISFSHLFLIFSLIFIFKNFNPSLACSFTEKNGTLTQVSGEVKVWDNQTQQWKTGATGMEVKHEDQIKTGKDSFAVLQYDYDKCDINEVPAVSTVAIQNPAPLSQPQDAQTSLAKTHLLKLKRCTSGTCTFSRPGVSPAVCVVGEQRIAQFKTKSWWGDTKIMK